MTPTNSRGSRNKIKIIVLVLIVVSMIAALAIGVLKNNSKKNGTEASSAELTIYQNKNFSLLAPKEPQISESSKSVIIQPTKSSDGGVTSITVTWIEDKSSGNSKETNLEIRKALLENSFKESNTKATVNLENIASRNTVIARFAPSAGLSSERYNSTFIFYSGNKLWSVEVTTTQRTSEDILLNILNSFKSSTTTSYLHSFNSALL